MSCFQPRCFQPCRHDLLSRYESLPANLSVCMSCFQSRCFQPCRHELLPWYELLPAKLSVQYSTPVALSRQCRRGRVKHAGSRGDRAGCQCNMGWTSEQTGFSKQIIGFSNQVPLSTRKMISTRQTGYTSEACVFGVEGSGWKGKEPQGSGWKEKEPQGSG